MGHERNMIVIYLVMTHAELEWLAVTTRDQHLLLFLFYFQVLLSRTTGMHCPTSFSRSTREPEAEHL